MKKNTLLYLDEDVVKKAKRLNINISKITEDALKQKLDLHNLKEGFDPEEYLSSLKISYYPDKIKKLTIKNIGPFKEAVINFSKVNIIWGKNASGKTFLINSINDIYLSHMFNGKSIINQNSEKGFIKLEFSGKKNSINYNLTRKKNYTNHGVIFIDDAFASWLTAKNKEIFLNYLKTLDSQVILFSQELPYHAKLKGINIIKIIPFCGDSQVYKIKPEDIKFKK